MYSQSKLISLGRVIEQLKQERLLIKTKQISDLDQLRVLYYPINDTRMIPTEKSDSEIIRSFLCVKGANHDSHNYIDQVINKGIDLIIVERDVGEVSACQIIVTNTRRALAAIAKLYFDDPSKDMILIGVTGTNGKTSIVKIIESILDHQGLSVGTIGTLGYTVNGVHFPSDRTTPDITELNQILAEMRDKQVRYVVMEISSHSLKLDRVYGLKFDVAIFSNLSREHLDFHQDMEDYYSSKKQLFNYLLKNDGIALINTDNTYGERLFRELGSNKYSISSTAGDIIYTIKKSNLSGSDFNITFHTECKKLLDKAKPIDISTPLLGDHNVFNITAAISAARIIYPVLSVEKINSSLPTVIRGRLQKVENEFNIPCLIDYAHTPEAIEKACRTVRDSLTIENNKSSNKAAKGRLICIIGAGGDRDKGKRKEMTNAALKYADYLFITTDNPRSENPADIILDMVEHLHPMTKYWITLDRRVAIGSAIKLSCPNDVILITGKGHETYQELATGRIPFDDYLVAQEAIIAKFQDKRTVNEQHHNNDEKDITNTYSSATVALSIPIELLQIRILLENNPNLTEYLSFNSHQNAYTSNDKEKRINSLKELGLTENNHCFQSISTDTRSIDGNTLFVALKGEKFDGHQYLSEALKQNDNWAIVDEKYDLDPSIDGINRIIRVMDTRLAYGILAKKFRSLFNTTVIAITGSSGKTSTKEYTFNILSRTHKVLKNIANENNQIGLSKTLLRLFPDTGFAVLEVGSNHFGEIKLLADICKPDIALITNIGPSHLEFFNNLSGVFREKSSLLKRELLFALVPKDEQFFYDVPVNHKRVGLSVDKSSIELEYGIQISKISDGKTTFKLNGESFTIQSDIIFNIINASFAIAMAIELGYNRDVIQAGLDLPISLPDRMEIFSSDNRWILSDCYNANPISMKYAIDYWILYKPELPHVAILGDMLELGQESEKYHQEIGDLLERKSSDQNTKLYVITIGSWSKLYNGDVHFENIDQLAVANVITQIPGNAVILLKGSHGIHLEIIKGRL